MRVRAISCTPEAETTVVKIARVSSTRQDLAAEAAGLLRYLIRNKHWSPFEHAHMTLEFTTSRAIATQLLRHRSFTFQEFSQRYASVRQLGRRPFEPVELRAQAASNRQSSSEALDDPDAQRLLEQALDVAWDTYERLLERGVARECARFVLPLCTQTVVHMTGSARSWLHFFELRTDEHAQKEVRELALAARTLFSAEFPVVAGVMGW